jgi:hypothetical protein
MKSYQYNIIFHYNSQALRKPMTLHTNGSKMLLVGELQLLLQTNASKFAKQLKIDAFKATISWLQSFNSIWYNGWRKGSK